MQQPQMYGPPTVITVTTPQCVGKFPTMMQCPICRAAIQTKVVYEKGVVFWVTFFLLLIFLFEICGCCYACCCSRGLSDVYHYCPSCNSVVGINKACS